MSSFIVTFIWSFIFSSTFYFIFSIILIFILSFILLIPILLPGRIAWYHGCLYQCSIESCTRQFFEKVFLKAHVESRHSGINFEQYLVDFGNANTVTHHHECELCGSSVLHTARYYSYCFLLGGFISQIKGTNTALVIRPICPL